MRTLIEVASTEKEAIFSEIEAQLFQTLVFW